MKTTAQGSKYELEAKKYLEAQGFTVFRVHKRAMFIKDKNTGKGRMILVGADIFGCDLVCKSLGKTLWVQVSVDGRLSEKIQQVEVFPWGVLDEVEIWLRLHGARKFRRFKRGLGGNYSETAHVDLKDEGRSGIIEEEPCENHGC